MALENEPARTHEDREASVSGGLLLRMAFVVFPLAMATLGFKLHKVVLTGSAFTLANLFGTIGCDLIFLAAYWLVWVAAFRLTSAAPRSAGVRLFQAATFALLLFSIAEHAVFVITGNVLDANILRYAARNFGDLHRVLASEMGPWVWAALLLSSSVFWLPPAISRSDRRRGDPVSGTLDRHAYRLHGGVLGALLLGLVASAVPVVPALYSMKPSTFSALFPAITASSSEIGRPVPQGGLHPPDAVRLRRSRELPPYNVVFIILESVGARSVTLYNPEIDTTPYLAELAQRGTLVRDAYAVVPHTSKALVPILCGIYPRLQMEISEATPNSIPIKCLPELLRERGYATAFFQPADEKFESRSSLVRNMGYEDFVGQQSLPPGGFEESSYFGYEDDAMLDPALEWVRQQQRPLFLTLLTLAPHHDYEVPGSFPLREFSADEEENRYLNAVSYLDRFVRKFIAGYEETGLFDETIFVIVGDHGEAFGEHGRYHHDTVLYEEGVKVPLLFLRPDGRRSADELAGARQQIDLVPTVAELLGYEIEGGNLPGRSIFSTAGHRELLFSCWYDDYCLALTRDGTKYVYHHNRKGPEVFRLIDDPREAKNLYSEGGAVEVQYRDAVETLLDWKASVEAGYRTWRIERIEALEAAVRRFPDDPLLCFELGRKLEASGGDLDRIEQLYRTALDEGGQESEFATETAFLLGRLLLRSQRWQAAYDVTELGLASDGTPELLLLMSEIEYRLGRPGRALELVREVVEELPMRPDTWVTLGGLEASQGNLDEALEAYTRAMELGIDNEQIRSRLAAVESQLSMKPDR